MRTPEKNIPQITVRTSQDDQLYTIKDSHLEQYPLFEVFDKQHFDDNTLPSTSIDFINTKHFSANPISGHVNGNILKDLAQTALDEIKANKKKFTHFDLLQKKNFNFKYKCGLIVLAYKDYPFVLKLFMENPQTFVDHRCKGLEPIVFLYMDHCPSARHLAGFTRIKNRTEILNRLASHSYWSQQSIIIPRKWFWLPKQEPWLQIMGKNIGYKVEDLYVTMPSIYGIIADKIDMKTNRNLIPLKEKKKIAMSLCNDLYLLIDPHITNYHFVPNKKNNQIGITLIDTEHFPSMVGLKKPTQCKTHSAWYMFLTGKCIDDMLLRTKDRRIAAQKEPHLMKI